MTVTGASPFSGNTYIHNVNQERMNTNKGAGRVDTSEQVSGMDSYIFSNVHKAGNHENARRDNAAYGCLVRVGDNLEWHDAKDIYTRYGFERIAEYYRKDDGTIEKTVTDFLEIVKNFKTRRAEMKTEVNKLAERCGISGSDLKKLKIEMDSSGKILVGGLADDKKTRKLQEVLNNENGFKARLKEYQQNEKVIHTQVGSMFPKGIPDDDKTDGMWGMDYLEYRAKLDGVDNLDGLGADPLVFAAAEIFRDDIDSADFSFKKKGLANPEATIQGKLAHIKNRILCDLESINIQSRMGSKNNEISPADVVSMDNVKITLTEDGQFTIEGRFAQSEQANSAAESLVMQRLQVELSKETVNGGESDLLTAMRQLRLNHDAEFGEDIGAKTGTVVFTGNHFEASVSNPAAEMEIHKEMRNTVIKAIQDETGLKLEQANIQFDENGKISFKNLPNFGKAEQNLLDAFKGSFNSLVTDKNHPVNAGEPILEAVHNINRLKEKLSSYDKKIEGAI